MPETGHTGAIPMMRFPGRREVIGVSLLEISGHIQLDRRLSLVSRLLKRRYWRDCQGLSKPNQTMTAEGVNNRESPLTTNNIWQASCLRFQYVFPQP